MLEHLGHEQAVITPTGCAAGGIPHRDSLAFLANQLAATHIHNVPSSFNSTASQISMAASVVSAQSSGAGSAAPSSTEAQNLLFPCHQRPLPRLSDIPSHPFCSHGFFFHPGRESRNDVLKKKRIEECNRVTGNRSCVRPAISRTRKD